MRSTEALLFHMPYLASKGENDWVRGFAASILGQSRKRNWRPTEKQLAIMQRLVCEMFVEQSQVELIE